MVRRALLPLLLLAFALPALAQAPSGERQGADEWGDDDEWGEGWDDDGPVLGDDVPDDTDAAPADPQPVGDEPPALEDPASEPEPSPPATTSREGADAPDGDDLTSDPVVEGFPERRVGDPIPLTRRAPLLKQLGLEVGVRYGLVGTGPTRFVDDIRFGVFDWLELRTALAPYPSSLMARVGIGRPQSPFGVFLLEGGLAHLDAGLRLVQDTGEAQVGVRAHLEAVVAHQIAFLGRFSLYSAAHLRSRFSMLSNDDQHAFALTAQLSYDLLPHLAVSGGLGYAQTLFDTPVREIAINFIETDRPGMSHFLARDDGQTQSLTVPLALTYGRVENFDVDLFATTRLWPKLDVVFGAGVRWRWWFGDKPWDTSAEPL